MHETRCTISTKTDTTTKTLTARCFETACKTAIVHMAGHVHNPGIGEKQVILREI